MHYSKNFAVHFLTANETADECRINVDISVHELYLLGEEKFLDDPCSAPVFISRQDMEFVEVRYMLNFSWLVFNGVYVLRWILA
jgi:hypothetical protein